ncbi:MAG: hypothetical protein JNJ49_03980 [Bdellovibrionaceae bacterium]|nr:hypothetical protein [Pseudobdellovibrionaceae bacterium]
MEFSVARYVVLFTVVVYFAFSYFDTKSVKDEREELIRLKTFELMQKLTVWTLVIIAASLAIWPETPAIFPVMALVVSSMYTEVFGKIYYRKKY